MTHGGKRKLCSSEGCNNQDQARRGGLCRRHGTHGSEFEIAATTETLFNWRSSRDSVRGQEGRDPGEKTVVCSEIDSDSG